MRVTVVGCGDAFGSGGRFNTCFLVESGGRTLALDFGASSLVALKHLGLSPNDIDAVVLSHLHGDHFGGLPFLFLDCQFDCRRDKPLTVVGPMGTCERVAAAQEVFFPGSSGNKWRFPLDLVDLPCRSPLNLLGFAIETIEVVHPSGAPSTGVRLDDGERLLAFSGDTAWTDALFDVARGADLLMVECFRFGMETPNHLGFGTIDAKRSRLDAKSVLLTHMSAEALGHVAEMERRGYTVAHDGLVIDL